MAKARVAGERARVTITLPKALVVAAKVYAVQNGTYLQEMIEAGLRRELERRKTGKSS